MSLHFVLPALLAWFLYRKSSKTPRKSWKIAFFIMISTMLVDLDHLLATPIFDPNRCSIGFHPLHSWFAIVAYFAMSFLPGIPRLIAFGLLIHMFTDGTDCVWMQL